MKIGPGTNSNAPLSAMSKIDEPVTSLGIRSGVNWMRLKLQVEAAASARATSVLPSPGAPSMRTCPRATRPTRSPSTSSSWPTTTRAISVRMRSHVSLRRSLSFTDVSSE